MDLYELAFNKVRVSRSYDVSQIKRALSKGIAELDIEAMTKAWLHWGQREGLLKK